LILFDFCGNLPLRNKSKPFGIKWSSPPIKALGVYYSFDTKLLHKKNFVERLDSVKKLVNVWSSRGLSVYAKVTVIKSLIVSKFVYIIFVTSACSKGNRPRVEPNVI